MDKTYEYKSANENRVQHQRRGTGQLTVTFEVLGGGNLTWSAAASPFVRLAQLQRSASKSCYAAECNANNILGIVQSCIVTLLCHRGQCQKLCYSIRAAAGLKLVAAGA